MGYYTILNNTDLLTADNEQALSRFYNNVLPLPQDYEYRKYIVEEGELVLNPNWEEEKEEQERQRRNSEIDSKISELQQMALPELLNGNKSNVDLYLGVINGLEQARPI